MVVTPREEEERTYRFSEKAKLAVKDGDVVRAGVGLIEHRGSESQGPSGTENGELPQSLKHNTGDQVVVITPTGHGEMRKYRFSRDATLDVRDKQNVAAGKPLLRPRSSASVSEIAGTVSVEETGTDQIVKVQGMQRDEQREYQFSRFERLVVKMGDTVQAGQALVQRYNTLGERFRWRVRPSAFLREMRSKLDEMHNWVNLSDGGHIENLATIELLRRRCKYILVGDAEADPKLHFAGLATLMRTASIDLGIEIDIDLDAIRLRKAKEDDDEATVSGEHWAIGKITYPKTSGDGEEEGYLLYLKSSFTGNEGEVIREYRYRNPSFPHQSTADQFFDEGQFEAYRALGQHIAEQALEMLPKDEVPHKPETDESETPTEKSLVTVIQPDNKLPLYSNYAYGARVMTQPEEELLSTPNEDLKRFQARLNDLLKSKCATVAVSERARERDAGGGSRRPC